MPGGCSSEPHVLSGPEGPRAIRSRLRSAVGKPLPAWPLRTQAEPPECQGRLSLPKARQQPGAGGSRVSAWHEDDIDRLLRAPRRSGEQLQSSLLTTQGNTAPKPACKPVFRPLHSDLCGLAEERPCLRRDRTPALSDTFPNTLLVHRGEGQGHALSSLPLPHRHLPKGGPT